MSSADMIVSDILSTGRAQYRDKSALILHQTRRTYGELAERVELIAGGLAKAGVNQGGRIALLSPNDLTVVETYLAAAMIGAVVVPLNHRGTPSDIAYQVSDAGVRFAIVHEALESLARDSGLLDLPAWFCGTGIEGLITDGERYAGFRPSPSAVLVQLYTSGTTGWPKGCLLTQQGWLSSIAGLAHATTMSHRDVVWPQLPLFHVAGVHFLLTSLAVGATYVLDGPTDPATYWERIRTRGVSVGALFPNADAIVRHPDAQHSAADVRLMFSQHTTDSLLDALPGTEIVTTYGATELGGMAVLATGADCGRPGAVLGRPLLGVVAAVLDDEDQPVPPGEAGELCFRGASTTIGYWNLPAESDEALRHGWLHSGDLGRADEDGFLYFVDRKKDMVKPGGENVYSIEVETALSAHPAVAECAVIGVPDERWGEAVKAVVVAREPVCAEDLDNWCLSRLAGFKRPRWYSFVDILPRNALAKVVKTELRSQHQPATSVRLSERS